MEYQRTYADLEEHTGLYRTTFVGDVDKRSI